MHLPLGRHLRERETLSLRCETDSTGYDWMPKYGISANSAQSARKQHLESRPPPFEWIRMDLLPKAVKSHKYILVIIDYATQYPEAVRPRKATLKNGWFYSSAKWVCQKSWEKDSACHLRPDWCPMYAGCSRSDSCALPSTTHKQKVKRFNQTLKQMLRQVVDGKDETGTSLYHMSSSLYGKCNRPPPDSRHLSLNSHLLSTRSWNT